MKPYCTMYVNIQCTAKLLHSSTHTKQFSIMKTTRIYVVDTTPLAEMPTPQEINKWNHFEKLPQEALDFIEIAEEQGKVYEFFKAFQSDFNKELINSATDLIFITDKY